MINSCSSPLCPLHNEHNGWNTSLLSYNDYNGVMERHVLLQIVLLVIRVSELLKTVKNVHL